MNIGTEEAVAPPAVLRSVYETQDEILNAIQQLHCPGGFDADLTFGHGAFWKKLNGSGISHSWMPHGAYASVKLVRQLRCPSTP